ncbi:MAG: hypothetical protein A2252_08075 [Elusimicrobia bacterium RIFOXYA2_FULL_39_19]|nr:MAG: hypothetical protein A2252_08075 [Elusimicrobia bacterium RIFOXYA2_FULL_39_19]
MLPLFIIIPLAGAFIISVTGKYSRKVSYTITWLVTFVLMVLSLKLLIKGGFTSYNIGGWAPPLGINLVADGLSILILVIINTIVFVAANYSIGYIGKYTSKWTYFALYLVMLASMNAAVLTGDLFNLLIWIEVGGVASYALVAFGTRAEELEASFKYAVLNTVGLLFILMGVCLLYAYTSTLNMADMAQILAQKPDNKLISFVIVLFLIGAGMKSAIVPFHAWLPDAHSSAPSPISALLSGVLVKSLGIYTLLRVMFNVFGITLLISKTFLIMGTASIILGGILAVYQNDIKRMLAYSTISQIGYIFFALGLGTPLGYFAALFHLVNHAYAKALMFMTAGAVVNAADDIRDIREMGGFGKKMPVTSITSIIGSMSISGIPPFGGFWSKLLIIVAAIQAGQYMGAFIAVIISIITLSYYLKLQKHVFFGELKSKWAGIKEAPVSMCVSMIVLAAVCIGLGLLYVPALKAIVLDPAVNVLINGSSYADAVMK